MDTDNISVIMAIEQYLRKFRESQLNMEHLSPEDVSILKGCSVRSVKDQEMDYKRGWAKLGMAQKINRLMVYHKKLVQDYKLDSVQQGQLKKLFYDVVSSAILDKDQVCYNSGEGLIIKIDGLKRDHNGIFFLDRASSPACQGQTKSSIQKFVPVSMEQLAKATSQSQPPRIKPMVSKKK